MTAYYRIAFCTVAMGRLDHIQQTLLQNAVENDDYPDAEFVLLDYGSKDGLGEWVRSSAKNLLDTGRLVYFRLDGVQYYSHAHSKNVCFLASTGTVLCNIDADNLIPRGFAFHLNDLMHRHTRVVANHRRAARQTFGRLAMFRDDFMAVGGYNESLTGWGYDDKDLRARLITAGCQMQWFDVKYGQCINHGNDRRVENMAPEHRRKSATSAVNARISAQSLAENRVVANHGCTWGSAKLTRNFTDAVVTGVLDAQESRVTQSGPAGQ